MFAVWRGHGDAVHMVRFSPDNSRPASASGDQTVRLWDGNTGARIATLKGHSHTVKFVAFSTDGSRRALASNDGTVQL